MKTSLKDLPFDQYSRQKIVADLMNSLRRKDETFTILDVGGYKGKTKDFLPRDNTTILDVFDAKEKDYIKGDGTNLQFKDGSFDFTVSFDVLEHIGEKDRSRFIQECARVSKRGFFLCCPFENGLGITTEAEKNLNDIYRQIKGGDHDWLKEHIDNRLPTAPAIEKAAAQSQLHFAKRYSNVLENWVAMQTLFFLSDTLDVVSLQAGVLNRHYNENLYEFDGNVSEKQAYRVIYFISKDKRTVEKVKGLMEKLPGTKSRQQKSLTEKMPPALSEIVRRRIQADKKQAEYLHRTIADRDAEIKTLRGTILDIQNSLSWKITQPLRAINKRKKRD